MARLNLDIQQKLEPIRINNSLTEFEKLGIEIFEIDAAKIVFIFKNEKCFFYPYSGWHTGKTIKDGRGLQNLLKQLKK